MQGELGPIASGQIAASQELRAEDLHKIAMQKAPIELATDEVQLKTAQNALEVQTNILKALKEGHGQQPSSGDPTADLVKELKDKARIFADAGDVVNAGKIASQASTLERNQAYIAQQNAKKQQADMDVIYGHLSGVHDQASWEQAIQDSEAQTGHPTPDFVKGKDGKLRPYDPIFVAHLKDSLLTGKDKALVNQREAAARLSVLREAEAKERVPLIKAQARVARDRADALEKVGATAPKASELQMMTDAMIAKYPGYGDKESMPSTRIIARPLIEEAIAMSRDQKIKLSEAVPRVLSAADKDGRFAGMTTAREAKGTLDTPLDLPAMKKDGTPTTPLRKNSFYSVKTGKYAGQVLYWDGKNFSLPTEEQSIGADESEAGDEEDPDEGTD